MSITSENTLETLTLMFNITRSVHECLPDLLLTLAYVKSVVGKTTISQTWVMNAVMSAAIKMITSVDSRY